jgi:hypothetical protein
VRDTVETAKWVWEQRETIKVLLKEVYQWLRGKQDAGELPHRVLIIGAGGCGKSTLGYLLSGGPATMLDLPGSYSESLGMESYALQDDNAVELVVPPGQEHRRDFSWMDLQTDLAAGLFRGLVLVSSFGYHSLGDLSLRQHRLYHGKKREFLTEYLADRRNEEIRILKRLLPFLRANPKRLWVLSLITKQDLWWRQRVDVEQHYRSGPYAHAFDEMVNASDGQRFRHELVINNFRTGRDELLRCRL